MINKGWCFEVLLINMRAVTDKGGSVLHEFDAYRQVGVRAYASHPLMV